MYNLFILYFLICPKVENNGEIDISEISQICKDFGVEPAFADIRYLLNMLNLNQSDTINFKEFNKFCKILNIFNELIVLAKVERKSFYLLN